MKITQYSMNRLALVLVLSTVSTLSSVPISADRTYIADESKRSDKQAVVVQDEREARATDIGLIAKGKGLPVELVEQSMEFQEAFSTYAEDILSRYPNQVSAVWVEPIPAAKGHIKFVTDVPSDAIESLARDGSLNPNNVVLAGHGKISIEDNFRRAEFVAATLKDSGYSNLITFFDQASEKIQIELLLPAEVSQPGKSDIVNAIQTRLQTERQKNDDDQLRGQAAEFNESDVNLSIFSGEGPIVTLLHSRGGNWLRDNGVNECTSGWSVSGPNGDGIITAGHCTSLDQFVEPGVAPYSMTWRSEVFNASGDVEYHTTSHNELDDFYSDAVTIRDVTGIRTTNTMVGNVICFYGRASNVRTCNHEVEAVDVNVVVDGTPVGDQARASNDSAIGGDSGGGWSVGNTAWGVQSSHDDNDNSYFTPVQQAQTALGVTIKQ